MTATSVRSCAQRAAPAVMPTASDLKGLAVVLTGGTSASAGAMVHVAMVLGRMPLRAGWVARAGNNPAAAVARGRGRGRVPEATAVAADSLTP